MQNCEYKSRMTFEYGSFRSEKCGMKNKDAHLEALTDYRYLISEGISNRVTGVFGDRVPVCSNSINQRSKLRVSRYLLK